MAITNHERVGKALELLKTGLVPFIERELKTKYGDDWAFEVRDILTDTRLGTSKNESLQDVAATLVVMDRKWGDVFRQILGKTERSLVNELLAVRNSWAHQEAFSSDDAYRALDSAARLLTAISAAQASEVEKMKTELLRVRFDEQARGEKRKSAGTAIESGVTGSLKPWREVVMPHEDVASGRYQQAEFAADLWQVHMGEGTDEYRDPVEFFPGRFLEVGIAEFQAEPVAAPTGEHVQVGVKYFLKSGFSVGGEIVDAFAFDPGLPDGAVYAGGDLEEVAGQVFIQVLKRFDMRFGYDQDMPRIDGLDIHECRTTVVLINDAGVGLAFGDLAKDAGFHTRIFN